MTPEQLIEFLSRHQISAERLAEIIGVTRQGIHHWLQGTRDISKTNTRLLRMFDKYPQLLEEFVL